MKTLLSLLAALLPAPAVLAAGSLSAHAQPAGAPHGTPMGQHQRMDPAKMQEMMAKRQAELKAQLKITAAQEPAWNTFIASMQPPAGVRRLFRIRRDRMPIFLMPSAVWCMLNTSLPRRKMMLPLLSISTSPPPVTFSR